MTTYTKDTLIWELFIYCGTGYDDVRYFTTKEAMIASIEHEYANCGAGAYSIEEQPNRIQVYDGTTLPESKEEMVIMRGHLRPLGTILHDGVCSL